MKVHAALELEAFVARAQASRGHGPAAMHPAEVPKTTLVRGLAAEWPKAGSLHAALPTVLEHLAIDSRYYTRGVR